MAYKAHEEALTGRTGTAPEANTTDGNVRLDGTCCLIDFDGTIANSLIWYNQALDEMFMGKVTDEHYVDHYKQFGDAYEIIPGSPWKSILMNLCRFLTKEHLVETSRKWDRNDTFESASVRDIGRIDCMLAVAYDASFVSYDSDRDIAIYEKDAEAEPVSGIVPERGATERIYVTFDAIATFDDVLYANEDALEEGASGYAILVPSGYVAMSADVREEFSAAFFYIEDIAIRLEAIFNERASRILASLSYDELAIDPVISFCKSFKEAGGTIAIHSGSNRVLVETMMGALGIRDLIDFYLCSDMIAGASEDDGLGPWGYKTKLIGRLCERYDGMRCFVVGDTKGDAFGAFENEQPFVLAWRGYPKDPHVLESAEGSLIVSDVFDVRQDEVIGKALAGDASAKQMEADVTAGLLDFAGAVKCGEAKSLALEAGAQSA